MAAIKASYSRLLSLKNLSLCNSNIRELPSWIITPTLKEITGSLDKNVVISYNTLQKLVASDIHAPSVYSTGQKQMVKKLIELWQLILPKNNATIIDYLKPVSQEEKAIIKLLQKPTIAIGNIRALLNNAKKLTALHTKGKPFMIAHQ